MEISLEDASEDIYINFVSSVRSTETRRMYVRNLHAFLSLPPDLRYFEWKKKLVK